ncbi:MAG: hypothetical protein ACYCZ0_03590 [Minisyncoccota bacterium]
MRAVLDTLKTPRSLLIVIGIAALVFAFAVWLPNLRLLFQVWADASVSMGDKVALPINLLSSIATNFTPLAASYTIAITVLTGINAALITELVRTRHIFAKGAAAGATGIAAGTLGLGCAACGSIILTSLLGTTGGLGVLTFLPLRGGELGIIGVALLGFSTYLLARQVTKPLVCEPTDSKS